MQDLKPKSGKKEPKTYINQNPWESLTGIGKGVKDSLVEEVGKAGVFDTWEQLLWPGQPHEHKKGGQLEAGQELDLGTLQEKATEVTAMGREFTAEIINAGKRSNQETNRDLQVRYHEILIELRELGKSSKELKQQVEILTVEQAPEEAGVYHVNFVENFLSMLRDIRENVDDGLAWFKALRSKKAARQYGTMAKKSGTSFTLANERVVSTQTG